MWWGKGVIEEERKWPTLIYPGCSLVWLVPSEHLAASHSLPLSPCDHCSPMSFLQGHKYFHHTPYCFHIILQTPPNDSRRQTMHPFSCDFPASLCSYTFYSSWRTCTYTTRGQLQLVPQTLHLKWYIKATCLRILHMIDVGNDSVFSVWKSYVCFSLHLRSAGKENARVSKQNRNKKDGNRNMHWVKHIDVKETIYPTVNQINYSDLMVIRIN